MSPGLEGIDLNEDGQTLVFMDAGGLGATKCITLRFGYCRRSIFSPKVEMPNAGGHSFKARRKV